MSDTNISFYLKAHRIHVFIDALRGIGSPGRICFMIDSDGKKLLLAPYDKRDFKSHAVPKEVYGGKESLEISSIRLCNLIADMHNWDKDCSYRIPGTTVPEQKVAVFNLEEAEVIEHDD